MENQNVNSRIVNISSVELIEIAVQIVSRNNDVIDTSDGNYALVPSHEFIVFLQVEKNKLCDREVIKLVKSLGYGKAWLVRDWYRVATPPYPF